MVKTGKGLGTVTDVDGHFSLQTKESLPITLTASFIGYNPLELDVYDTEEPIEIQLSDNTSRIDEVVVVGYGAQKRTQLTGSVVSVKADIFEKAQTPSMPVYS